MHIELDPSAPSIALPAQAPVRHEPMMWLNADRVLYVGLLGAPSVRTFGAYSIYVSLSKPHRISVAGGAWQEAEVSVVPPSVPHRIAAGERMICNILIETDSVAPGGANLGFAYPAQWVMELPQRVTTELATWRDLLKTTGVVFGPNGEPAPSGHAELADLQALPSIGADPTPVRNAYRQFLLQARPRIFLLTGDQKFGTATSSAALTEHLKGCTERKVTCAAYAVDDTVVWGKQQAAK